MICYSCVNPTSLETLSSFWIPEMNNNIEGKTQIMFKKLNYYSTLVNSIYFVDTPFILVGTKLDLASSYPDEYVSKSQARRVCEQFNGAVSLQCSALTYDNVDKVFETAVTCGLRKLGIKPDYCLPCCEIL